jgi:Ca2+-binding EF-hand superfamily protein
MKTRTFILATLLLSASAMAQETANTATTKPTLPTFEKLDTNSDGRISAAEAQAEPALAAKLPMLDKQGKGYITREEYQAFVNSENEKRKS